MSNNDLQKRNPIRNMQMALNTACAMGTAAMMSTMFAYADVTSAINKVFKLRDLDRHSKGYLLKVIAAGGSGLLLNVITDPFLGYFRNIYIFGQEYTVAQALSKIAGGVTFVNSVASTICVVILYLALRPALERAGLLPKGEKK